MSSVIVDEIDGHVTTVVLALLHGKNDRLRGQLLTHAVRIDLTTDVGQRKSSEVEAFRVFLEGHDRILSVT